MCCQLSFTAHGLLVLVTILCSVNDFLTSVDYTHSIGLLLLISEKLTNSYDTPATALVATGIFFKLSLITEATAQISSRVVIDNVAVTSSSKPSTSRLR